VPAEHSVRRHPDLCCRGACRRKRQILAVVHGIELGRRAIDLQVENVGPIIVPGKVVPQLHLDA